MSFRQLRYARQRDKQPGVLIGLRRICGYAHISPHTFYKWTKEHDFTAARLPDNRWCTSFSLIDEWIAAQVRAAKEARARAEEPTDKHS